MVAKLFSPFSKLSWRGGGTYYWRGAEFTYHRL